MNNYIDLEEEEEEEEEEEFMDRNCETYTWKDIENMQVLLIKSKVKGDEELPF